MNPWPLSAGQRSAGVHVMQLPKAILLLLLISVSCRLPAQPVQKIYSGWELSCDNNADCQGRNIDHGAGLVVSFYRAAGESSIQRLHIEYRSPAATDGGELSLAQRLLIDGQPWPQPAVQSNNHSLQSDDPQTAQGLLNVLLHAAQLNVQDANNAILTLTSLPAFFQKMTEIQAGLIALRQGLPTSPQTLVVEAAPAVVPALTSDEVNYYVNYAISQISVQTCPLEPVYRKIKVFPVSHSQALLLISCESAAYNTFYQAWLVSRHFPLMARRLVFRLPFSQGETRDNFELTNVGYDPATRQLTTVLWGRSLADCGTMSRWKFEGQQFVLQQFASESVCDRWHSADNWPVLWSADPVTRSGPAGDRF